MRIHKLNSGKNLIAFLGPTDPFSNFFYSKFHFEGEEFSCVEMAFVVKRLRLLELHSMAAEAMSFVHMNTPNQSNNKWGDGHPRELKWYGAEGLTKATPYNRSKVTTKMEKDLIEAIVKQKFRQNEYLEKLLKATNGLYIVEASPDKRWGVGFKKHEQNQLKDYTPKNKKYGQNWMGEILTKLREKLIKEEQQTSK
uniref:NADAR domain-containing protein n=1 Tax=Meloidogyne incognita TaxID=6306 RepID=A0A914M4E8_MELIC